MGSIIADWIIAVTGAVSAIVAAVLSCLSLRTQKKLVSIEEERIDEARRHKSIKLEHSKQKVLAYLREVENQINKGIENVKDIEIEPPDFDTLLDFDNRELVGELVVLFTALSVPRTVPPALSIEHPQYLGLMALRGLKLSSLQKEVHQLIKAVDCI